MNLKQLIEFLSNENPRTVVPIGFDNPHSYRGYYEQLAFEPTRDVTVYEMLECAKGALGKTFTGYKGGEYVMSDHTTVYLAEHGCCGEEISEILLRYMVGDV